MIYLVRHCQSSGQEPDAPLTPLGSVQAEQLRERLGANGCARIVSSPYLRARQSVEPLAASLGLVVETDHRLVERVLSPEPLEDWRERLRAAWDDMDLALPGGESSRAATSRGLAALEDVLASRRLPVVVAAHGNLIALLLHALDRRPGYACWERLTNPDVFRIERIEREPAENRGIVAWQVTRIWSP